MFPARCWYRGEPPQSSCGHSFSEYTAKLSVDIFKSPAPLLWLFYFYSQWRSRVQALISKGDINQFPLYFYLPRLSAKQLSKECHPDPPPHRGATLPSHPTPNHSINPCILQFRVSGGGQRVWCGWEERWGGGSSVECCSSGGGDGLKVILIWFTTQIEKRQSTPKASAHFTQGRICTNWLAAWKSVHHIRNNDPL